MCIRDRYYDHYGEALVNTFDTTGSYGLTAGITNAADELGYENACLLYTSRCV